MLRSCERLKRSKKIQQVLKKGQRVHSQFLTLFYLKETDKPEFQAAVIIGLKVSKKAVVRNLAKRRVLAALREFRQEGKLDGNFVFLLKPEIAKSDWPEIKKEVFLCLKRFSSN